MDSRALKADFETRLLSLLLRVDTDRVSLDSHISGHISNLADDMGIRGASPADSSGTRLEAWRRSSSVRFNTFLRMSPTGSPAAGHVRWSVFIERILTNRTNRNCRSSLKMFWGVCLNPEGLGRGEFAMGAGDYKKV